MKVLVVDVGGSNVKVLVSGAEKRRKFKSGGALTPQAMIDGVREHAGDWQFDVVTVGVPAPVVGTRLVRDPRNLGAGWANFDFEAGFGRPTRLINDAAMQALGSYEGGRMLFLGFGTGLGAALVDDGHVTGLELAHLPFRDGSYEDAVGDRGLERLGTKAWRKAVFEVVELLREALIAEYVVIGGGNVKKLDELPPHCRRGANALAFIGGFRLWGVEPAASVVDRAAVRE